jgi:hypothetical protein
MGLDTAEGAVATARLDEMENDPDPQVRKRAKVRMGNPFGE